VQLRGAAGRVLKRARLRGDAVECPCCERTWSAFAADWNRPNALCPYCGSHERHRGLWLYLRDRIELGREPLKLLHFAPEFALRGRMEALETIEYVTADLDPSGVDVRVDITDMPFPDGAFDAILCSHVLEHVEQDRAAMSELARVLSPGGWLLVLVPLDVHRERTYEDPAIQSDEDRKREFLQHDHVRLYAPDIADRLAETGLEVRAVRLADEFGGAAVVRHGLLPEETVFHCTHPSSSEV
jgi:SAM-dependent methyltransferase